MAEAVGFEPTVPVRVQLISSQSRYDHFDTLPCRLIIKNNEVANQPLNYITLIEACQDFFNYQFKYLKEKGAFSAVAQRAVNQSSINQHSSNHFHLYILT